MPLEVLGNVNHTLVDTSVSRKLLVVRSQRNSMFCQPIRSDTVVRVGLRVVEVESKEELAAFKDDDLVAFVLERDVGLQ